ncbi:uncharacterized protein FA14DRAFT_182174 [Meira miltonrushii]|uniref:Uncharacterized protein n=1 Tax=Meira miltonrushii TaxID=1280837 RepID=A0A316V9T8_9BASI|nr:uncharacterized protein FA14DRAFT_182174 [Meira miltonrushii]PWN32265.1 hypothetical protein FA14DRAFT_182174 [Meira miltonrushii]
MYFNPPAAAAAASSSAKTHQNVNRSEEESEKNQDKGKQKEIDQTRHVYPAQNPFQMSASLQQRSLNSFAQPSSSSSAVAPVAQAPAPTTFAQSFLPVDFSQLANNQPSRNLDPFIIDEPSLDALIKVKRLMEKSDVTWKQIYAERQKQREMNSSSTNEDSDPFPSNDLQANQFQLDPSNLSSDTGESQSLDQSFNGMIPNNLGQYPILHTPLQPGAAALLNMTESLDLSSTALQPENSNQAYKPTKMTFSDPFASDRAGKDVQTPAKNAPEVQLQKNAAEVQGEGESSGMVSNTSKRAYPINRTDQSPNEDPIGKRERRAGEPESDQMEAEGEIEVNRIEEVAVMNSNSSPQRGRRSSVKGRCNRSTGGTQRKSLRPRANKAKEAASIVELPASREHRSSHPESSSSAVAEQDANIPTSEPDAIDVGSQKAQKAVGDLMRQQQLWQNVVSNLKISLRVCNLRLSRIGLQLEEAQRDTVEKQKMQHFHEVEQLVRHDMALNMQQAASQLWMQNSVSHGGQLISSFAQQPSSLTTESAPWVFNQPVYNTQIPNVWPAPVQNAPVSMPSSDSTDSTFASQYLEYAPGQFQQIQKSYAAGAEVGNASMESLRVTLKHPTEVNIGSSSSSDAASVLPQTNQQSQYTFATEDGKAPLGNKPASTIVARNSLPYPTTNPNSLVPQQQLTPVSAHPAVSRAQSVPNRTTKMPRPTSSKGTPGPVKDIHFILTDYGSNGDVTWKADDNELAQRLASKFYLPNQPPFPIRPLHEGVLRRIHDEWLHAHSFASDVLRTGDHGLPTAYQAAEGSRRYFPPVEMCPDAAYLRQAWQELERRRILNLANFPDVIEQLRKEATDELKREASQRAMMSATMMNVLTWASIATQEPPAEAVDDRARLIWERRKAAATYAVGLLRQAEYCVAEGFRAFAVGQPTGPEKEAKEVNVAGPSQDASTSHAPPAANQSRHHRDKYGKKGEAPSNVYSATLPHGGTGSDSDAVLASPSILSNATFSPEAIVQVKRNAPERRSSNGTDSWDATMMRRIGSK